MASGTWQLTAAAAALANFPCRFLSLADLLIDLFPAQLEGHQMSLGGFLSFTPPIVNVNGISVSVAVFFGNALNMPRLQGRRSTPPSQHL